MSIATFDAVNAFIQSTLGAAQQRASAAITQATSYAQQLNLQASTITAPVVSTPFQIPSLQPSPAPATIPDIVMPVFSLPDAPSVNYIDDTTTLPELETAPAAPTLNVTLPPTLNLPAAPTIPAVDFDQALPTAPLIDDVPLPSLTALVIPSAPSIVNYSDALAGLERPTLSLVAPTATPYDVAHSLLRPLKQSVEQVLLTRLGGGTGLDPVVEAAIWAREAERERIQTNTEMDTLVRTTEQTGFALPPGTLAAQIHELHQRHFERTVSKSRDIAIEQARLELQNLQTAIAAAMQADQQAYDESLRLQQLTFDAARTYIEQQIAIYNAGVNEFTARVAAYRAYVDVYRALIEAERNKVEIYRAQIEGEKAKAEINTQLVALYEAQIRAGIQRVEIYKAQLDGVRTLVEVEKTQVEAAGEQIKAFTALVNAETVKLEAYKAQVGADAARADIYKSQVDAYEAKARTFSDRFKLLLARQETQATLARVKIDAYNALVSAQAEQSKAQGQVVSAQLGLAETNLKVNIALNDAVARANEVAVKHAEAVSSLLLSQGTTNAQLQMSARQLQQDAQKVASQVYAQVAASSIGVQNVSTSMSATANAALSNSTNISNAYNVAFKGAGTPNMREIY